MPEDSLDLQPGDYILYQDEEIREEDGVTFVAPGIVGKVLSIHSREEMRGAVQEMLDQSIPRRALVEFENGIQHAQSGDELGEGAGTVGVGLVGYKALDVQCKKENDFAGCTSFPESSLAIND